MSMSLYLWQVGQQMSGPEQTCRRGAAGEERDADGGHSPRVPTWGPKYDWLSEALECDSWDDVSCGGTRWCPISGWNHWRWRRHCNADRTHSLESTYLPESELLCAG